MPFVSLIIPVYNVEKYIKECLDSILEWSFVDWEAILIDDGSKDNSGVICDEYVEKDARFRVIHQKNGGVSRARNAGLDVARGTWCWFVDSDDLIDRGTPVNKELLNDKDIVIYDIKTFIDGEPIQFSNKTFSYEVGVDLNAFYDKVISYTHPTHWYHKRFWSKKSGFAIRFSEDIALGEDLEFMRKCELLSQNPIKISYINYYYRLRLDSACHNAAASMRVIEDAFKVLDNLLAFIEDNGLIPQQGLLSRFTNLASSIPANALKIGKWDRAMQHNYRCIINRFEQTGYKLSSSKYIWLATRVSWLLNIASIAMKKLDSFNYLGVNENISNQS